MVYLQATDPRGKRVICSRRRWEGHILKDHAILKRHKNLKEAVIEAIEKPTEGIFQDRHYLNRQCYYSEIKEETPRFVYLKIVVAFDAENEGAIITVMPKDGVSRGEECLWIPSRKTE